MFDKKDYTIIILFVIIVISTIFAYLYYDKFNNLNEKYNTDCVPIDNYNTCQSSLLGCNSQVSQLEKEINSKSLDYDSLLKKYGEVENKYTICNEDFNNLNIKYDNLENEYNSCINSRLTYETDIKTTVNNTINYYKVTTILFIVLFPITLSLLKIEINSWKALFGLIVLALVIFIVEVLFIS